MSTTYCATPTDLASIQEAAGHLAKTAAQMGVIVTIDLVPQRPLAMGNYAARVNVWPQRESAVLRSLQVEYSQQQPLEPNIGYVSIPTGLLPATAELVQRFATALAAKLSHAERKYGYADGWQKSGWMDECRDQLLEHLIKGDPRDVAAYCAFLWHHGEHTSGLPTTPPGVPEPLLQALRFYARQEHYHVDDSAEPVNEFDTVSGEPANWLHSMNEGDVTMIEDGSVARMALRGQVMSWIDGDEDGTPKPGSPVEQAEPSPTAGMTIEQRILHVGGRNNAAGYVEFGSTQAVEALVRQVLRDLPPPKPPAPAQDVEDALRKVMEQAQVFASAWSLVGGPFDSGDGLSDAEDARTELETVVRSLASAAQKEPPASKALEDSA